MYLYLKFEKGFQGTIIVSNMARSDKMIDVLMSLSLPLLHTGLPFKIVVPASYHTYYTFSNPTPALKAI